MSFGYLKIKFTKNNIFINILNHEKKNITLLTAGIAEFQHRAKNSFLAYQALINLTCKNLKFLQLNSIFIYFKGWSKFQRRFFIGLLKENIKIKGLKVDLKVPHGGVRLKKIRNK